MMKITNLKKLKADLKKHDAKYSINMKRDIPILIEAGNVNYDKLKIIAENHNLGFSISYMTFIVWPLGEVTE